MKAQFEQLGKIKKRLEEKLDSLTETFNNRSEAWHESEKAEEMESKLESLQEAINNIEYAMDELQMVF